MTFCMPLFVTFYLVFSLMQWSSEMLSSENCGVTFIDDSCVSVFLLEKLWGFTLCGSSNLCLLGASQLHFLTAAISDCSSKAAPVRRHESDIWEWENIFDRIISVQHNLTIIFLETKPCVMEDADLWITVYRSDSMVNCKKNITTVLFCFVLRMHCIFEMLPLPNLASRDGLCYQLQLIPSLNVLTVYNYRSNENGNKILTLKLTVALVFFLF